MSRNLEVKAKIDDISIAEKIAIEIGADLKDDFTQIDTYFNIQDGRLKLREFDSGKAELIFYRRDENNTQRWSDYEIVQVCDAEKLKNLLSKAFGVKIVVEKRRKVYIYKNARIHIDSVKELGNFIEFEVIYNGDEKQVFDLMRFLIEKFNLDKEKFIKVSYSDLLIQKQKQDKK